MKKIVLETVSKKKLIEVYGASNVSRALAFKTDSFLAREIRQVAINTYNGQIVTF